MMNHDLETCLARSWPPGDWNELTILVAVSGGADSVALLRALTAAKQEAAGPGRLLAAHFNHQLRGSASDADQDFVEDLCRRLGVTLHLGRGDPQTLAASGGDGMEAAARKARYAFLAETAGRLGARYVVTAHTADDQAETILHRIVRGTGIAGLSGVPRVRPFGGTVIIRPMLDVCREQVLAYLAEIGQSFRVDESNTDRRFTRNRIRHELLPLLNRDYHPGAADALRRLGVLAREAQAVIDRVVEEIVDRTVTVEGACRVRIDVQVLSEEPRYLIREAMLAVWRAQAWPMQAMGTAQWEALADLVANASGGAVAAPCTLPGGVTAMAAAGYVHLARAAVSS